MYTPDAVTETEWHRAHEDLIAKEKELTRAQDRLAAERRRQPGYRIGEDHVFEGPGGEYSLTDLFEGRRQLVVYHFMLAPGSDHQCEGCSMVVDNLGHPEHLNARDTTLAVVSRAPYPEIAAVRERMGWTVPWYSSFGGRFNEDMGVTVDGGENFGLSVFIRDDSSVYRTYFTQGRGVEKLGTNWSLLDLTPLGRQELWEDSPEGVPQGEPYAWWRLHGEYGD
ncbi:MULTISPECIES: DUF899 domain-containing protein [unclassified Nocardiopsis]|uniref:DUF899 domain-containing protein n=1 Tax=unclassified Nocardiopsis TaxID=2649073 RepID=UPI00066BFD3E|nr:MULTISPECIES: DUF899 domain-containing protein [unclassified Nocardiopsis]MBQ1081039.1 DUF899 domain-containing protein [Nocardiopsis sp. B62]